MKKSIKRFLVLTQVLGLSALAATACTKNASETKPPETTTKKDDASKTDTKPTTDNQKEDNTKESTSLKLAEPKKLDAVEQAKVQEQLTTGNLFTKNNLEKMENGTFTSSDNQIKGLPDKFPVLVSNVSNDEHVKEKPTPENAQFLNTYVNQLEKGGVTTDQKVAPSTAIDPNKNSIDGVDGKLDPIQAAPPKKSAALEVEGKNQK